MYITGDRNNCLDSLNNSRWITDVWHVQLRFKAVTFRTADFLSLFPSADVDGNSLHMTIDTYFIWRETHFRRGRTKNHLPRVGDDQPK